MRIFKATLVAAVASLAAMTSVDKADAQETVNIGFLAALSGPDAGWGLPGLTGNQMFVDRVNAEGGLDVCGTRYKLNMISFDDEATGSKALQGAKQLVLEHDVKFISAIGGNPADATHPFLTQKEVVYASLISTDIKPDRPYLIAGGDVTPRIDMMRPWYHKQRNPDLKRWAVLSQDDTIGLTSQAWEVGSALADGWDVVYDEHYSLDTVDFAPIVTAVLATNPDVVSLNLSYPDFVIGILEQLHSQGYEGEISANYLDSESILTKVPAEFIEGAVDSFPLFDDPYWGGDSVQKQFFDDWMARFGPGGADDVKRGITGIDWDHVIMLEIWAQGVQMACSFEAAKVVEALQNADEVDTLLGKGHFTGAEMWGVDNMVATPVPINEHRAGVKRVQQVANFEEWFQPRKEQIIEHVRSKGMMFDQR
ncbi:MAG: ABC transporter substrate-binding protein [Silicimonas sp.]|nr:ABC transporter substrate-binding protein [Silicimonas sp.]